MPLVLAVLLSCACSKNKSADSAKEDARQFRDTEIVLEECDLESEEAKAIDANGDGQPELVTVFQKKSEVEVCRAFDLNFDGKMDRTVFLDAEGLQRRIESDFDRDGMIDEIAFFESGALKEKHRATSLDGKLDTWEFYENNQVIHTERDENGDGVIDQWWEYPNRGCPLIHVDIDSDGRPDPGSSIDYCKETGYQPPPLPSEVGKASSPANFGSKDEGVEEVDNRAEGATPATTASEREAPATNTQAEDEETTAGDASDESDSENKAKTDASQPVESPASSDAPASAPQNSDLEAAE